MAVPIHTKAASCFSHPISSCTDHPQQWTDVLPPSPPLPCTLHLSPSIIRHLCRHCLMRVPTHLFHPCCPPSLPICFCGVLLLQSDLQWQVRELGRWGGRPLRCHPLLRHSQGRLGGAVCRGAEARGLGALTPPAGGPVVREDAVACQHFQGSPAQVLSV